MLQYLAILLVYFKTYFQITVRLVHRLAHAFALDLVRAVQTGTINPDLFTLASLGAVKYKMVDVE